MRNQSIDLEESFKSLKHYGHYDSYRLLLNLENLVILYILSENDTKNRVLLLGYVSQYQKLNDRYQDSMISFRRLKGKHALLSPEKYYVNMREGFLKHLSSLYMEGLQKYPACVKLRLSYAYFL